MKQKHKEQQTWAFLTNENKIIQENDIQELIQLLTPDTDTTRVKNLIKRLSHFDRVTQSKYIQQISEKTGWDKQTLRETLDPEKRMDKAMKMEKALEGFTDYIAMAERFNQIQPIYYDESKNFWMYDKDKNKWSRVDETDLMNKIDQHAKQDTVKATVKNKIIESLQRVGRKRKPEEIPNTWIQFPNVIVDVAQQEEIQPNSKYFTTNPIPWKVGETTDTPTIDKILHEWVEDDDVQTLYEILAYALLPSYPIHRVFCFTGTGMNGKSKFLELITQFVGKENVCSTDFQTLQNSRFEKARLYKKLVCQMGETNFQQLNKTSMFKRLTGQDYIGFEFKQKDPISAYNYAKIMIATNSLPPTTDKTDGFYRRWCIVEFPNQFEEGKNPLQRIPEQEYRNLARKCVEILPDLLERNSFTNEGTIDERREKYEELSNPLGKFLDEFVVRDPEGYVYKWEFLRWFKQWQRENGYREWTDTAIGKRMNQKFDSGKKPSPNDDNKYWRSYLGIRWSTPETWQKDAGGDFHGFRGFQGGTSSKWAHMVKWDPPETSETSEVEMLLQFIDKFWETDEDIDPDKLLACIQDKELRENIEPMINPQVDSADLFRDGELYEPEPGVIRRLK